MTEKATRQHIGLWYLDPYARKGKRSGTWANTYRDHAMLNGVRTVLSSNNSNFIKPAVGYYGYLWGDVLAADATEAFTESPEGFYDKTLCQKLVKYLFAAQNTITPEEAYRAFRRRDAIVDALLRSRDFPALKGN